MSPRSRKASWGDLVYVTAVFSGNGNLLFSGAEKQAHTPKTRKGNHGVYNTACQRALTSEYPGNKVEFKNTDQPPVKTADN